MEEGPLARGVHEDDCRRGGDAGVLEDPAPIDSTLVEELEDEIAEGVGSHLPDHRRLEAEPDQRARGIERASAAVQRNVVHQLEGAARGQVVDGPGDRVRDEDPETHDVGHGTRTTCTSRGPWTPTTNRCSMSALRLGPVTIASALGRSGPTAAKSSARPGRIRSSESTETCTSGSRWRDRGSSGPAARTTLPVSASPWL